MNTQSSRTMAMVIRLVSLLVPTENVIVSEEPKNQQHPGRPSLAGSFRKTRHVTWLHGRGGTFEGSDGVFGRHTPIGLGWPNAGTPPTAFGLDMNLSFRRCGDSRRSRKAAGENNDVESPGCVVRTGPEKEMAEANSRPGTGTSRQFGIARSAGSPGGPCSRYRRSYSAFRRGPRADRASSPDCPAGSTQAAGSGSSLSKRRVSRVHGM